MKKIAALCALFATLIAFTAGIAGAIATPVYIDGAEIPVGAVLDKSVDTTYVPIRAFSYQIRPGAKVSWEWGQAVVRCGNLTITAREGNRYIEANGRVIYARAPIISINGSIMIPVRALSKAFDATASWDDATASVRIRRGSGAILPAEKFYNADDLLWLARIISAESEAEPFMGKVAVGNVVLNRVRSPEFPDTIWGVIFDRKWGVQFEPTANGRIYLEPTAESVRAAKMCLEGTNVIGDSLYFLNPAKSSNFWIMQNRPYVAAIGEHLFYA
ncbi:MAG TPA: copper amine oxidase [Papillibacter sp.]|jgi:N-acetylmuramoyl-L-alanine amidase|nr:copper amine oxidase [Papillibacter sp.]